MQRIVMLCIALTMVAAAAIAENGVIEVEGGQISGVREGEVAIYKGIPYAAPPVGALRWKPPQPVVGWEGVKACEEFGPECPQTAYPQMSLYYMPERPESEDCLTLNVWSAAKSPEERRPVMVWIHGGGLTRGSGAVPAYDGTNLAQKGVVVVTINYRLNAFGFLAHPELSAESEHGSSGNYGILDQIAALEWVRDNIAQFGGDPENVTIFGESAGSWSVNVLMASPLAKGLFHRAIGQSGGQFGPSQHLKKEADGVPSHEEQGVAFAKAAGVESLEELRALPAERILEVFTQQEMAGEFSSRPSVDGWLLPDEVRKLFARGEYNDVPLLAGSNADEMTSLTNPGMHPRTMADLQRYIAENYESDAEAFLRVYPATADADVRRAYLDSLRDQWFTLNMRRWVVEASQHGESPAYLYFFNRHPPLQQKAYFRAYHAAEIGYVFDNLDKIPRTAHEQTDVDLADTMSAYWVNFATDGDPNGEGLPEWDAYDTEEAPYMEFGDEVKQGQNLLKSELDYTESNFKERVRR